MPITFPRHQLLVGLALAGLTTLYGQPAVTSAVNASSYQNEIAPGSWFVLFGRGMGPAQLSLHSAGAPFPAELSGSRVSFTPASGGSALEARLWYTSAGQLAGLLPSSAAPGAYDVRVTYNGQTSNAQRVQVVARNFGFATQSQNGQGPAQATINDAFLNRFTTGQLDRFQTRPAQPGDVVVLWGTGLGADTASDTTGATSGDQTAAAQVRVLVGGIEVTPAYAGRSNGSPGLDQINFVVPSNVQASCFVPVQVRAGGRLSNQGSLAIAGAGQSACSSSTLTPAQLSRLDSGGTLTVGTIALTKISMRLSVPGGLPNIPGLPSGPLETVTESASAVFARMNIAEVANDTTTLSQTSGCYVYRRTGSQEALTGTTSTTLLDAGPRLTLNGPNASNVAINKASGSNSYGATLYSSGVGGFGGQGNPTLGAGSYTVTGPGGTDVGAFNASINVPGTFNWTNQNNISDPISRSSNLIVNWTGGGDGIVTITGVAGSRVGGTNENPIFDAGVFSCTAPASAGTFSVPASVLQQLPAVQGIGTSTTVNSIGMLTVMAMPDAAKNQGAFTAPLTAGGNLDWGFLSYQVGSAKMTGWQ